MSLWLATKLVFHSKRTPNPPKLDLRNSSRKFLRSSTISISQWAFMQQLRRTSIESREWACGRNYLKITIFTSQVTLIFKHPYLLEMLPGATQVLDNQRIFLAQIGNVICEYMLYWLLILRRNFAENVGIKFFTPEEFFLKQTPRPFTRTFEPGDYSSENTIGWDYHCPLLICYWRCSSVSKIHKTQPDRHSHFLWQSRCWEIYILLEAIGTSWLC